MYEAFGNAVMAREGGAAEKAGAIVLFSRTGGDHNGGIVTVQVFRPARGGDNGNGDTGPASAEVTLTDEDRKENTVAAYHARFWVPNQ